MRNMKRFWRAAEVGQFSHFSKKKKKQTNKNLTAVALEDRLLKVSLQEIELWFQSVASLSRKSNFSSFFFPHGRWAFLIGQVFSVSVRPHPIKTQTGNHTGFLSLFFFCRLCINTGSFLVSKKTGLWGIWESWRYFGYATKELLQPTPETGKRSAWKANARTHKRNPKQMVALPVQPPHMPTRWADAPVASQFGNKAKKKKKSRRELLLLHPPANYEPAWPLRPSFHSFLWLFLTKIHTKGEKNRAYISVIKKNDKKNNLWKMC